MTLTLANVTPERRKPDTVVTSENLSEYINQKLDIADAKTPAPEKDEPKEIKQESLPLEADAKDSAVDEVDEVHEDHTDDENKKTIKKANSKIEKRFAELTTQRNEAKARADAAEKKAAELEAKLKPEPIKIEDKEKPNPSNYTDPYKYAEDLAEWSAKKVLKERDESDRKEKIENERKRVIDSWNERMEAIKKEIPDYSEKIASSEVVVSNDIRDAILDSDVGPKILLHLAENPDEATKIGKMTVGKALIALGRIEAKLSTPVKESLASDTETKPIAREAEVSKAPSPISPLKGASAPADLPINSKGEWTGSHEQYKEARRAGKIK